MPTLSRTLSAFLLSAALLAPAAGAARAQGPGPAPADAARPAVAAPRGGLLCPSGIVTQIFVDNSSVFDVDGEGNERLTWAYRLANRVHVPTREGVIRRELLFREGDCYDQALLEDSERILRSVPFIADADVFAVRQTDGSQHVVVQTRDEWSFRLEPQWASGGTPTGLELREDNLFGRGQQVAVFVKEQQGERIYGASWGTRQLLGTRLNAELGLARTPVGVAFEQRLAYPFRGEGGRIAFLQQFQRIERNFEFLVAEEDGRLRRRLFPEERTYFDVGTVFRLGRRGNLTLFGIALSGEWTAYPQDTLTPRDDGMPTEELPGGGLVAGLDSLSSVRLVFLAGQRNVWFERREALDAVRGAEDVKLGVEVEVGIGRSLETFSDDDDLSLELGFTAAGNLPGGVLAGVRAMGEGRRDFGARAGAFEWRNLFAQMDAWAYWRPGAESRHTWVAALSGDGGWRTTVPFQLTLGNRSGLRGYERHTYAGERRLVGTLEHRAFLGWPYPRLFDLGSALFVDVGKSWPGGDAFGVESPVQVGAGAGLRIAFPPGSRTTYRLDFAIPVAPHFRPGKVQISFGIGQAVGRRAASDDDGQIRRSSRRALSASLFSFPN